MEVTDVKVYSTDFLLDRLYSKLESITKTKHVIPNAIVERENKRTYLTNFREICEKIARDESDVVKYYERETGANISVSGTGALTIQSIMQQRKVEGILRKYIEEFVQCSSCKSLNTKIIKKNKVHKMLCSHCNVEKSLL